MIQHAASHNHDKCISAAVSAAERICEENGARLTDLRRRVLELVWSRHKPITAYEVLDLLREERSKAAPPTVYRALDFLIAQRLIHRIESLNAFIGCGSPGQDHRGGFLVCSECHAVVEIRDCKPLQQAIGDAAAERDFAVTASMVEVIGLCRRCHLQQAAAGRA